MRTSGRDTRPLIEPIYSSLPPGEDGMVINLLASAASGIVWRFRNNAQSASPYKWEFVGGSGWHAEVITTESTTSGPFTDLATVGPSVTVPVAGIYVVAFGSTQVCNTSLQYVVSGITVGGVVAPNDQQNIMRTAAAGQEQTSSRTIVVQAGAAAALMKMQYAVTGGVTGTWARREMTVTPVRVG